MADLKVQGQEYNAGGSGGYLPSPSGLVAAAFPTTSFAGFPTEQSYNPNTSGSASDSTTLNSSGQASLTLSAGDYYVVIIDKAGKPHWFAIHSGWIGDGQTHSLTYTPAPYQGPPGPPNFFVGFLKPGIATHALGAFGDPNQCRLPIAPLVNQGSGAFLYEGMVTNPVLLKFSAGDKLLPLSLAGWYWPDFAASDGVWDATWTAFIVNADGTQSLFIINAAGPVATPVPFAQLAPAGLDTSADNIIAVGTDIVVPSSSSSSITTTAGGLYTVQLGLTLQGGSLS